MSFSNLDLLTSDLQQYIVAPLNAFGLGGFVFDVDGEEKSELEADVTDNYAEDNEALHDHIARKAQLVTLRGYVGEVVYSPSGSNDQTPLQQVTQQLTEITDFLPQVSAATQQIQSLTSGGSISNLQNLALSSSADLCGLVENILGSFDGQSSRQERAYAFFKSCWRQGILMGIQTPWEFLTNMAITRVIAIRDEKTTMISDIAVTYKQMRFAQTQTVAFNAAANLPGQGTAQQGSAAANASIVTQVPTITPVFQGASAIQAADPVNIGPVPGMTLPTNALPGAQSLLINATDLIANPGTAKVFQRATGP